MAVHISKFFILSNYQVILKNIAGFFKHQLFLNYGSLSSVVQMICNPSKSFKTCLILYFINLKYHPLVSVTAMFILRAKSQHIRQQTFCHPVKESMLKEKRNYSSMFQKQGLELNWN